MAEQRSRMRVGLMLALTGTLILGGAVLAPLASAGTGTGTGRVSFFDRLRERFATAAPAPAAGACADVKVIGARGTGEPPGLGGLLSRVSREIDAVVDSSVVSEGLDYPASANFTPSVRAGVTELNRVIDAETAACPAQRIVLTGYSQGAWVVGDTLAARPATDTIAAVVFFGDPRFNSVEPFNVGTFGANSRGVFVRPTGELAGFNDAIQSFCNGDDGVCQGGGITAGHLRYNGFVDDAATFVATRL